MKEKIVVGVVGFGGRGTGLLKEILLPMTKRDVEVAAVCDVYPDRAENAAKLVEEYTGKRPLCTLNYKDVTRMEGVDAVIAPCAWEDHVPVLLDAMRHGKYAATEVGGAYSLDDCFELVRVSEETGMPCMLLENCCYGRREMAALNMVKLGLFGDIVHCAGGYCHDLRDEIAFGDKNRHYRLRNYLNRNCENYPTHELGPIAKVLNINNGNRFVSLTSMASCAKGLHEYIVRERGENDPLASKDVTQGDVFTTIIKCAHGETIELTLDTTLPRFYSRRFTVRGTKGLYTEDTDSVFLDGVHNQYDFDWTPQWGNAKEYLDKYDHPLWAEYKNSPTGGHGGMDWLVFRAFIESVKNGTQTPIDVYDTAAWMAITPLSEQSAAMGGMPVAIPDFTRGQWTYRSDLVEGKYALHTICEDKDVAIF